MPAMAVLVTVSVSGAQSFSGTDTVPNPQTCADVLGQDAASDGGAVMVSAPVLLTGPNAAFTLYLDNYHGPGTCTLAGHNASVTFLIARFCGCDVISATRQ